MAKQKGGDKTEIRRDTNYNKVTTTVMLKQYLIFTCAKVSISRESKLTDANMSPFDVIAVSIDTALMHTS